MPDSQKSTYPHLRPWWKHWGTLVWLLLVGVPLGLFFRGTLMPPASRVVQEAKQAETPPGPKALPAPAGAAAASTPDPASLLRSQLEQVIAGVREANQKKDLSQLLNHYSPNFPQLPQRAQTISKSWKIYNYPKMEFTLEDIKLTADHAATAKVTWEVEAQNISTWKINQISETYVVRFVKESGQWRIRRLEKGE